MKRTGWVALVTLVIFAGAVFAVAQESAAPVANPVSTTVKNQLPRFSKNMVAAAEHFAVLENFRHRGSGI